MSDVDLQEIQQAVTMLYRLLLEREPDEEGLRHHVAAVQANRASLPQIARDFATSAEFLGQPDAHATIRVEALGCSFILPANTPVIHEIASPEGYEPWVLPYFLDHCRPGMTVLDIGASLGAFALPAARRVGSAGKVYALEVSGANCRVLARSIRASQLDNVTILPFGASDRFGTELLRQQDFTNNNAIDTGLVVSSENLDAYDVVPVLPIDMIRPGLGPVHVIKMHIEGMEYRVSLGALALLREWRPVVFAEYSPLFQQAGFGVDGAALLGLFIDLGYDIEILHRKRPREWVLRGDAPAIIARVDAAWRRHVSEDKGSHLDLCLHPRRPASTRSPEPPPAAAKPSWPHLLEQGKELLAQQAGRLGLLPASAAQARIPAGLVEACYSILLGRAVESPAVVADKIALRDYAALLTSFVESEEYRSRRLGDLARACYRLLLRRDAENDAALADKMALGDEEAVLASFINSAEYRQLDREESSAPSAELIEACYQQILGRPPESRAAIESNLRADYQSVLATFLSSDEYKHRAPPAIQEQYLKAAAAIEVDVAPAQLTAMFERIRHEWSNLGDVDPFWSVLTDERFRAAAIDEGRRADFYASGAESAGLIDIFAGRSDITVAAEGTCLEFGCGVGRVTGHLARRFSRVIAVDISAGNLALCRDMLEREGIGNVETVLLRQPEDVRLLPDYDFLFSTIVLQHNPPPIQHFLLDVLLSKLTPRGLFLFQIPTHTPGYSFDAAQYLASAAQGMEMHCLPMPRVMRLLARHGCSPFEVLMDGWTGLYGSHSFFGMRERMGGG